MEEKCKNGSYKVHLNILKYNISKKNSFLIIDYLIFIISYNYTLISFVKNHYIQEGVRNCIKH